MPSIRYAALLRGINVGGRRIAMADLRDCLDAAGFANVKTVLASGNVLFDAEDAATAPTTRLEKSISERFGFDARAIVVPTSTIGDIIDRYPFAERDGWHSYVVFYSGDTADELAAIARLTADLNPSIEHISVELPDATVRTPALGLVFWQVERGHTLDSVIGKRTSKRLADAVVTNRNLNTLRKLR